jgi:UDP-N-acetylglucosamine--N-acetylmuramyl-(pentapeptide) pyrophosphoryl-undecaprenol N-acetylglucosamine transferase
MARTALIMAGGTGGHVFPALALAQRLRDAGWKVDWLGSAGGMENRLVPAQGYPLHTLGMKGVRGKGLFKILLSPWMVLRASLQAFAILLRVRPSVVVGFGGFASLPGGLMAILLRRPLILHEQNAVAGLANRVLALGAARVYTGFPLAFAAPSKHPLARWLPRPRYEQWIGNPVRPEISALPLPELRLAGRQGPLRLLVLGGSQGARALNEIVPEALQLMPVVSRPEVIHQGGEKMLEALKAAYQRCGVEADLRPFIGDMAEVYAWCDWVICRSGALTVAELCAAGVAGLLVPFPAAVDNHQRVNGEFLEKSGAALILDQASLKPEGLAQILTGLNPGRCLEMSRAARSLARPAVVEELVKACGELSA